MEENNSFDLSSLMLSENFESDVNNQSLSYENLLGSFILNDETILCLVNKESEHLPRDDYLERLRGGDLNLNFGELNMSLIDIRMEAVQWIWMASACYDFGHRCLSLAVNYLDRFLSTYNFESGHDWTVQSLALGCLSIAAKMEEKQIFLNSEEFEFGESMFVFDSKDIHQMELLVLDHLNWKMQSSTPCLFVDYFLKKITCEQLPEELSMLKSAILLLDMTKCIDFLEFRPSEIAAATAIYASKELEANEIDEVLTRFSVVEKEKTLKCLELMKSLSWIEVSADDLSSSDVETDVPAESPVGVLDSSCLSFKSDETSSNDASSSPEILHDDGTF